MLTNKSHMFRPSPRDSASMQDPHEYLEMTFGIYFVINGCVGFFLNAITMSLSCKQLAQRGHTLFLLIANFSLLDCIKAAFAVYMGGMLITMSASPALSVIVLMLNFGNVCSVFGVILASVNEYLYIRLPLHYRNYITKCRVLIAIVVTWLLAIGVMLGKYFSIVTPVVRFNNSTRHARNGSLAAIVDSLVLRKQQTVRLRELYDVVILACLLFSQLIILFVYIKLYHTIREQRDTIPIRKWQRSSRHSSCQGYAVANERHGLLKGSTPPAIQRTAHRSESFKLVKRQFSSPCERSKSSLEQNEQIFLVRVPSDRYLTMTKESRLSIQSAGSDSFKCRRKLSPLALSRQNSLSPAASTTKVCADDSLRNRRKKCITVILTVCLLYLTYLTLYFALQLHHMMLIIYGVTQQNLTKQYIVQFILRALFALHATLNPLAFLRIRSFRHAVKGVLRQLWCKDELPNWLNERKSRMPSYICSELVQEPSEM